MAIQRLAVEEVQQTAQVVQPPQFLQAQQNPTSQPSNNEANLALLSVFKALSQILAIRLFLLLAVVGSFVLAYMAMSNPDPHSSWVLAIYNILTIIPLVTWDFLMRSRG
jgi:hypothetical protein